MSALRQGILSELRRGKSVRQILRGLGERKQGDQILAALEILAQGGVRLEGRDLTAGITTCGKLAQWRQALLLATSARSFQVQPSIFGYNAGISACERAGQWQRALQLLALMPAESLDPGVVSCSDDARGQGRLSIRVESAGRGGGVGGMGLWGCGNCGQPQVFWEKARHFGAEEGTIHTCNPS
ncbi:unnamed protein product [Effrenium voratum]|uniref:Pentatricopeptide repeat-containing protein n=1 Tax=Effrenium voratum TaxID=2562239 RepID=A0AA36HV68_9DINO|nr:unnamed protein product [Effrenium voratum]